MTMNNQMNKKSEARKRLGVQLKSEVAQAIRDLAEDSTEGRRCFTRQEIIRTLYERLEAASWTDTKLIIAILVALGFAEERRRRKGSNVYRMTAKWRAEGRPSGQDYEAEAFNLILQQLETEGLIQKIPGAGRRANPDLTPDPTDGLARTDDGPPWQD
jgi:hypothetical protein